ncbi:hypothetical protein HMI54_001255 [Coelomomyces lativittatus]|nr:hypothetical protein HMI55_001744 [Coelomomyces lativittatus]KAJ1518342.1 hypothetical protein HMI54_001255 [Coelomomyces lativittatus]
MKIPVSTSSSKIMNTRRNMPEKMDVEVTTHDGPCVSSSISSGYKRPRRHTHPLHPTSLLLSPRNKQTALNVPSSSSFKKLKVPSTLFPHPSSASPFNGHLNLPSLDSTIPFGNSTSMLSSSLLPISMSPSSLWSTVPTSSRSPPLPTTTLSDPNPPEWCVILKNDMQQVVLYNPSNHALIVVPDRFQFQPSSSRLSPNPSSSTAPSTSLSLSQETRLVQLPCHFCPLCQQPYSITLPPTSNVTPSVPMSSSTNTTVSTTPAESAVASSFSGDHPITTSPRVKDPSLLPSCSDMPFMDELNSPNNTYQTRMGRSTTENYKVNDLEPEMESGSNQLVHTSSFMHRHYFRLLAN